MKSLQALLVSCAALSGLQAFAAEQPCSPSWVFAELRAAKFTRVNQMRRVPEPVVAEFWRAIPSDSPGPRSFADPNEEFQETDVISTPPLPWRRLIFAGVSSRITFIYYEKGGYTLDRHLFVSCSDRSKRSSFSYLAPRQAADISPLLSGLEPECLVAPPREYLEQAELARCL